MSGCQLCPRGCGVERPLSVSDGGPFGVCGVGRLPVVARAAPHFGEEPCISGTRGAGTVFFSGCTLQCVYCQNHEISTGRFGREVTVDRLREIFDSLIAQGVHNLDLVTPMHFTPAVLEALERPISVPVIVNTGGYENVTTLRQWKGKADIYLPDLKYTDDDMALRYSHAADYPEKAKAAITEMVRQTGPYVLDDDGLMRRGVIIRHLMLPGGLADTCRVIVWVASEFGNTVMFSLMSQYTPVREIDGSPALNRRLTTREYTRAMEHLEKRGITAGYTQALGSATVTEIPAFDLTGIV